MKSYTQKKILYILVLLFVFILGANFVSSQFFDGNAPSCSGATPCAPGTPIGVNTTDNDKVIAENSAEIVNFTIWFNASLTFNITSINFSIQSGNLTLNESHAKSGLGGTNNGSAVFNSTRNSGRYTAWMCDNFTSRAFNLNAVGGVDYFCRTGNLSGMALDTEFAGEHWRPTNISAFWFVVRTANLTNDTGIGLLRNTETPGNIIINITVNASVSYMTSAGINSTIVRLTLDSAPPRVNLSYPGNNTWTKVRVMNFTFIPEDNFLKNCSLYGDFGPGGFVRNLTSTGTGNGTAFGRNSNDGVLVGNNSLVNITAVDLPDNNTGYTWGVACYDRVHHLNFSKFNRTLKVDTRAPVPATPTSSEGVTLRTGASSTLTCSATEINPDYSKITVGSTVVKTCDNVASCSSSYDFTSSGTHTLTCDFGDEAGSTATKTLSIEVTTGGDSQTKGDTPGRGGGSSSVSVNTQTPNQEIKYVVNNNEIGVNEIVFAPTQAVSNAKLTVKSVAQPTEGASEPETTVYKYFEVNKVNFGTATVNDADITFTVSDTWLIANGLTTQDVHLLRYNSGAWQELTTTYVRQQSGYHHFKADTPGFSLFSIASKKKVESGVQDTTTETGEEEQSTEVAPTKEKTNMIPFVLVLLALIVIAAIVYFVLHKKHR